MGLNEILSVSLLLTKDKCPKFVLVIKGEQTKESGFVFLLLTLFEVSLIGGQHLYCVALSGMVSEFRLR